MADENIRKPITVSIGRGPVFIFDLDRPQAHTKPLHAGTVPLGPTTLLRVDAGGECTLFSADEPLAFVQGIGVEVKPPPWLGGEMVWDSPTRPAIFRQVSVKSPPARYLQKVLTDGGELRHRISNCYTYTFVLGSTGAVKVPPKPPSASN